MGRRGPLPSENGKKTPRTDTITPLHVVDLGPLTKPAANPEWLDTTIQAWEDYWHSGLVDVVLQPDAHMIRRLFDAYDRYDRLMPVLLAEPMVEQHGEIRANPVEMMINRLEGTIVKLEGILGIGPLARQSLKIAVGKAALTADDINRRARGDSDEITVLDGEFTDFTEAQ